MVFPCSKLRVYISPGICVMLALMILILPIQWILAVFTAALFHEMCHAGAVIICGGRLRCIYIGRRGAQMQAEIFSPAKEMLCTLAGPIGGFLLLLFIHYIPRIAVCAAVHSLYNLLPLPNLDGGRTLEILFRMLNPAKAEKIVIRARLIFLCLLWLLCGLMTFYCRLGVLPLIFAFSMSATGKKTLQTMNEKGTIV